MRIKITYVILMHKGFSLIIINALKTKNVLIFLIHRVSSHVCGQFDMTRVSVLLRFYKFLFHLHPWNLSWTSSLTKFYYFRSMCSTSTHFSSLSFNSCVRFSIRVAYICHQWISSCISSFLSCRYMRWISDSRTH